MCAISIISANCLVFETPHGSKNTIAPRSLAASASKIELRETRSINKTSGFSLWETGDSTEVVVTGWNPGSRLPHAGQLKEKVWNGIPAASFRIR